MTQLHSPDNKATKPNRFVFRPRRITWSYLLMFAGLLLSACSQIPTTPQSSNATATHPVSSTNLQPVASTPLIQNTTNQLTETVTPLPTALASEDTTHLAAWMTLDAYIETQLATQAMPTATSTPCLNDRCSSATNTRTPYITRTPTLTRTPTFPLAYLQIAQPGPLSKVISPIHLAAKIHTLIGGNRSYSINRRRWAHYLQASLSRNQHRL